MKANDPQVPDDNLNTHYKYCRCTRCEVDQTTSHEAVGAALPSSSKERNGILPMGSAEKIDTIIDASDAVSSTIPNGKVKFIGMIIRALGSIAKLFCRSKDLQNK